MKTALYRKEGKVGIITLNRPNNYNAITDELLSDFGEALDAAMIDKEVRAVVIYGNGKGFCAGADLGSGLERSPRQVRDHLNMNYGNVVRRLAEMEKPVIAAVHGSMAGAGIGFGLACDFRIMADTANIRYAFINIGLTPDAGSSWFLVRAVGLAKAMEIAAGGEKISASECQRLGLATKVVPEDELMETAMTFANTWADRPTLGFALTKKTLRFAANHSLLDTIAYEAEQQVIGLSSHDFQEGGKAFMEKRKPNFKGE
ncbi:MAG: enoyl-CoA hydratase-related protein [Chitinophagales bacterium]